MIPLVDMMTCDCLHDVDVSFDVTYASFVFTCDTLFQTNVDHVDFHMCDDLATCMPCYESFKFSPIVASKKLNNFSFQCLVCNNVDTLSYENAPIAFSNFGDSSFCHVENFPFLLHIDHSHMSYIPFDFGVFGDVQMERCVIMDDAFMYHAHNFFLWNFVCNGSRFIMSTSIEHELTKRALESIFHESCGSIPPLFPFPCVASNKLNNAISISPLTSFYLRARSCLLAARSRSNGPHRAVLHVLRARGTHSSGGVGSFSSSFGANCSSFFLFLNIRPCREVFDGGTRRGRLHPRSGGCILAVAAASSRRRLHPRGVGLIPAAVAASSRRWRHPRGAGYILVAETTSPHRSIAPSPATFPTSPVTSIARYSIC